MIAVRRPSMMHASCYTPLQVDEGRSVAVQGVPPQVEVDGLVPDGVPVRLPFILETGARSVRALKAMRMMSPSTDQLSARPSLVRSEPSQFPSTRVHLPVRSSRSIVVRSG